MEVVKEELLHCSICMEIFSDPRTLPCQHTFCRDCLTSYIEGKRKSAKSKLNAFDCPLCRRNTTLENYDSNGGSFPKNLVITSLLNINHQGKRYQTTSSTCDKACQTSKETRFLRNKFSQTNIIQSKEVAAQTSTRKTNKRTQTDTEKAHITHNEPQAQKQHQTTQTDGARTTFARETIPGMQCDCHNRPVSIWIFHFIGDKWDRVFFRGFDNLIEKLIIRYVILTITADFARGGAKEKLKIALANVFCYLCLMAYVLLMLCLSAGIEKQHYVFMIIILYKFACQALTIRLTEYPGFCAKDGYFINILFIHVLWFWTMLLCSCLLLYSVCLLIAVRGHPNQKIVCVTDDRDSIERCRTVMLKHPEFTFLKDWSFKHLNYHLSQFLDLNFSDVCTLVNELFRHVINGEALMVKEEYYRMGRFSTN